MWSILYIETLAAVVYGVSLTVNHTSKYLYSHFNFKEQWHHSKMAIAWAGHLPKTEIAHYSNHGILSNSAHITSVSFIG